MVGDQEGFNPLAEEAMNWTREQLSEEDKEWLRSLRFQRQVRDFTIVHATLDTPAQWGYVFNNLDAAASFTYQHTAVLWLHAFPKPAGARVRILRWTSSLCNREKYPVNVVASGNRATATGARGLFHAHGQQRGICQPPIRLWPAPSAIIEAGRRLWAAVWTPTLFARQQRKTLPLIKPGSLGDIVHALRALPR